MTSSSEHTLPRLLEVYRMPTMDTSIYSGYAAVVLSTVLKMSGYAQSSVYFVTVVIIAIILATFLMQVVLLLPSCNRKNHQNIWTEYTIIEHLSVSYLSLRTFQ